MCVCARWKEGRGPGGHRDLTQIPIYIHQFHFIDSPCIDKSVQCGLQEESDNVQSDPTSSQSSSKTGDGKPVELQMESMEPSDSSKE